MSGSLIPLAYNPVARGPDLGHSLSLADFAAQMQERQQQQQSQNALKQVLGAPGAVDPTTGQPTPQTMQAVMGIDPNVGMKLGQNALAMQGQRAQLDEHALKRQGMLDDLVEPVRVESYSAYQTALKAGQSEDAARAAGQRVYTEQLDALKTAGHFSEEETKRLLPNFDPQRVYSRSPTLQAQADKQQQRDLERQRLAATENRADQAGWQVMTDPNTKGPDGNPVQYRYKASTGEATTLDMKPYTPSGAAKVGTGAAAPLSDEAATLAAERVLAGDKSAMVGFGRTPANLAKITNTITKLAQERGMDGADVARKIAEFMGDVASERALGTRKVGMEIAANEVKTMAPLALSASKAVDRTKYPMLNSVLIAAEKGTGDENVVRFGLAVNSLIYTYSKFLNPTGIPTDADKAKATEILSMAWSKGQFEAAIDQIKKEIASGQSALKTTRQEVGEGISGKKPEEPAPSSGASSPPAKTEGPAAGGVPTVDQAAYAALPKGSRYIAADDPTKTIRTKR